MTLLKSSLAISFTAMFAAFAGASAAPLPAPQGIRAPTPELTNVDYRRCYWRYGRRVCRYYEDNDYDYDDYYPGYGGGGIYFYGGGGRGHHHGGGGGDGHGHGGGGPGPGGGGGPATVQAEVAAAVVVVVVLAQAAAPVTANRNNRGPGISVARPHCLRRISPAVARALGPVRVGSRRRQGHRDVSRPRHQGRALGRFGQLAGSAGCWASAA